MQDLLVFGIGHWLLELCGPLVFIGFFALAIVAVVWRARKENV